MTLQDDDTPRISPERAPDPEPASGSARQTPPEKRPLRHMLLICCVAAALGYLIAGWGRQWLAGEGDGTLDFETMNTYGRIIVPRASGAAESAGRLAELALAEVRRVNDLMSPFGEDSDVRRLNEAGAGEWIRVDPLTWTVVMEALRWHRLSGGAFDPTIGPLKRLFDFNQGELASWPEEGEIAVAREKVGAEKLLFEREGMRLSWAVDGMRLDLGAIAKGFAADRAAEALMRHGAVNALVDIGGELRVLGMKPGEPPAEWQAGIRDPRDGSGILERLSLMDAAVATSGNYERFFTFAGKKYEHIIDPRKGLPLSEGPSSVTAVHPESCLAADALATTMSVLGVEAGEAFLREQALGLFSRGVRVIMVEEDARGAWRRVEMTVDAEGGVRVEETVLPEEAGGGPSVSPGN